MSIGTKGEKQRFFICDIKFYDIVSRDPSAGGPYADLHVTEIALDSVEGVPGISQRRFIELRDFEIVPGGAKGTMLVDGHELLLDYAWSGEREYAADGEGKQNRVLAWTVRVRGENADKVCQSVLDAIIVDEHGTKEAKVPRDKWLKHLFQLEELTLDSLRAALHKLNDSVKEQADKGNANFAKLVLTLPEVEERAQKLWETEVFDVPIMLALDIRPWRVKKPEIKAP